MPPSFPLHFGRYRQLAADVAGRLDSSRTGDPLRPGAAGVIVASSGVAAAIAREAMRRTPTGVAALQLQTIDDFARRVVNASGEFPRVATDAERRLTMRAAIRSIEDPIAQSRGIGSMLERSWRDMRDSGLSLAGFRKRVQNASLRNRDRTRLIIRAWAEFERLIAILGAIDTADVFARAAQLIDGGADVAPQIVAGFYDLTGSQRSILEALARAGKLVAVYVPAASGEAYAFARPLTASLIAIGATAGEPAPPAATSASHPAAGQPRIELDQPRWDIGQFERRDSEIRGVCEDVARLLETGTPPSSIGIVARTLDEGDVHLFNRFAAGHGFATTSPGDVPLIAHRIGRAAVTILRLRENGFPRADVLEIVRDGFKARTRIHVDKADEVARRYRIAAGTSAELASRGEKSPVLGDYVNLVAELEELTLPLSSPALRGAQWHELLAAIVSRFAAKTAWDLGAIERIEEIAATCARADRLNIRFDPASVIDAFEQSAIDLPAAPAGIPTVWLGDVMRFRGRSFEHLFAVRMQDEILPQRRIEDPLVPDADRRRLNIREIGEGREEERLLFQLIADGTSSLHFTFSGTDGFGRILRPSQLLKNFVIERHPERKQELLEDFSKACIPERSRDEHLVTSKPRNPAAHTRQLQLIARTGTNGPFDGFVADPALRERFKARLRHISPTKLEDFGECPQKFLLKEILRVSDVDDPDRDLQINIREKGSLDHGILEYLYSSISDAQIREAQAGLPRLPSWLAGRIETGIDEAFDQLEQDSPAFNRAIRDIERRLTKANLRDFIAADLADLAKENLWPRWYEYSFGSKYAEREGGADHPEPFVVTAGGVAIEVDGQIDRIDMGGGKDTERYRIVDYKSGKAGRHNKLAGKIDAGVRLQLAIYALAVARFFSVEPAAVSGTIKPLVISENSKFHFELSEHEASIRETLDIFAAAISRGEFPAFPEEKNFDSCRYCPVKQACRTRHDAEEKYAVLKSGDPRTLLGRIGAGR